MRLITIKKAHIESELFVLKSKLESEGIKCFMKNEFTTQIMNYLPSFEVELQVSSGEFEKAIEILNQMQD
ncbi:putative signal transducing protein [Flavicella sediminum]|uniref:putative signal transducing protein n=1 Tax=Flavicella sediminum TaxID=2585141 RepID=UPI0011218CD6|nr:DUF2007 domain-containing protein [Flavicella sediminum]